MSHQGQKIAGRYVLLELAGEGGMASVWRAEMLGAAGFTRTVAVKEIKAEFHAIQSYIDMFVEEARVVSDLAHPNIVQVQDFVMERGRYYLVMEWVEGLDLASLVRVMARDRESVPWTLCAAIALNALHGLSAAHERRMSDGGLAPVIHRDVSPPNILLGINGTVKLTDFGLARARDRIYSLTAPGTVKGRLSYLAPEVTYGMPVTAASDLFSAGVVMWETLAGRSLFRGPGDMEIFKQIRRCHVPPLDSLRPDLPERLVDIVHRALMPEPGSRFPSARAMADALVEVLRATDAGPDLPAFLADAITDAYRRYRGEDDDATLDEVTLPHVKLPAPRPAARGPLLFNSERLEVEFSDSDVTTRPEGSSKNRSDFGFADTVVPLEGMRAEKASRTTDPAGEAPAEAAGDPADDPAGGPADDPAGDPADDPANGGAQEPSTR